MTLTKLPVDFASDLHRKVFFTHKPSPPRSRAAFAAALPFGVFGAAAGAAAFGERVGELAELDGRLIGLGQLLGQPSASAGTSPRK